MAFASPTDAYTGANVAAMTPEKWSPIVNEPKFDDLTILNFVTDLSPYMTDGGDIVHVPNIYTNTFTVQTQSTQGAGIVDESVAQVDTYLTVNLHKYIGFIMGDLTIRQLATSYQLNEKYATECRKLLLGAIETSLFGLWSSISTNTVGDTATVLTDLEIRTAVSDLDSTSYELDQCAFFIHPVVFWLQLAGVSKYYDSSVNGKPSVIRTGAFGAMSSKNYKGTLYGVDMFTSSRVVKGLETYRNLLLHQSAFGVAVQTMGGGRIRVQAQYQLKNLGMLTVVDTMYGVAVLREAGAVLVNANDDATTS